MTKEKLAKIIRVLTIAPIMALLLLVALRIHDPEAFRGPHFILAVVFIVILPVLSYPLQRFLPRYRDRGREGQRTLAVWMSNLGYLLGIVSAVCFSAGKKVWVIYLTYFISGGLILFFNNKLKIKASGHACGVTGPVAAGVCMLGPPALFTLPLLALVYWSSLAMRRHTMAELITGTLIPLFALAVSFASVGLVP